MQKRLRLTGIDVVVADVKEKEAHFEQLLNLFRIHGGVSEHTVFVPCSKIPFLNGLQSFCLQKLLLSKV